MVQYLVTYSVQTGKEQDHDRWLHDTGMKYFQNQQGFQGFKSYSTLIGGGPDWVLEIDFDSAEHLIQGAGIGQREDDARGLREDGFWALHEDLDAGRYAYRSVTPDQ